MRKVFSLMFVLFTVMIAGSCQSGSSGGQATTPNLDQAKQEVAVQSNSPSPNRVVSTPPQQKPVSIPGAIPTQGGVPLQVHFYDAGSYDPDGDELVGWEWNFADEEEGKGGWHDYTETKGDAWHTYLVAGVYTAHLRVTDATGRKGVGHIKITLEDGLNANPIAQANATPLSGNAPLEVSFSAQGSYDPDGNIIKWEWDFGTGIFLDYTPSHGEATTTYGSGGLYTAILRVTDDDGAMGTNSVAIEVNSPPTAVASASPTSGTVPLTIHFSAQGSYDPDGFIVSYEWDFGEGGGFQDFTPTQGEADHTYIQAGTYTATLRVVDDWGVGITAGIQIDATHIPEWHFETVDSEGKVGWDVSLAFDTNGYPAISYNGQGVLKFARWNSAGWGIDVVDTQMYYGVYDSYTSLAFDADGNPAISYFGTYSYSHDLKFARWDGSSWNIETVDSGGDVGRFSSLVFDSFGNPAISYYDYTGGNLKFARWNSASWGIATVDGEGDVNVGSYTSLAFDANGNPAISYRDVTNADLKFAHWSGTSWDIEMLDPYISGEYTSLAFNVSNYPAISYFWGYNYELRFARWDGSSWGIETVDDVGYSTGRYTSLAFDGEDLPTISYYEHTYGYTDGNLKLAHWSGTSWDIEVVDSEGNVGRSTSLAFDANGNPAISYFDWTNYDLKFAWYY